MANFAQMEELAKDSSSAGRNSLLRALTDLFLDNLEQATDERVEIFGDIVCRVLDDVVEEARAEYAARIAPADRFPRDAAVKLAWDTFEVAEPVLECSPVLRDSDLVAVAGEQSDNHLLAISRRAELHERVTDALIARGSDGVIHSVAGNPGAQISDDGFGALADKARDDAELQAKLVERQDVTADLAAQLEPFLSAQLKKKLDKNIRDAAGDISGFVAKARDRVEQALVGKRRDQAAAEALAEQVQAGEVTLSEAVIKLAGERRPVPLGVLLARVAEMPEKMIANTMLKVNGMPLAITCRALKLPQDAFDAIIEMRGEILRLPETTGEQLAAQYADLDETDAARTLRFLKVRHALGRNAA